MGLVRRVRVYARVAVPLILGALVKSQMLEVVLQARAFTGSPDRTFLHEADLRALDWLAIAGCVLLFAGAQPDGTSAVPACAPQRGSGGIGVTASTFAISMPVPRQNPG